MYITIYSILGQRKTCYSSRRSEAGSSSSSSHSSKISVDYVNSVLNRLRKNQTRDSTIKNYLSIWRHLNKFIISLDCKDNLCWEEKTALFGTYLVDGGVQSSTLKSYFSAIKFILKQDGYQWDEKNALLSSLVKGCRLENDKVKIRLPIQKGLLELLLFKIDRKFMGPNITNQQPYLVCMYQTLFPLAYYGKLRVGELTLGSHTVKADGVNIGHGKDKVMIALYTSKTHGEESEPQKIKIFADQSRQNKQKRFFCPVQLLIQYMAMRGEYILDRDQFFVFRNSSPVKPWNFRTTLRSLLTDLGLDASLYDVHSARSIWSCGCGEGLRYG